MADRFFALFESDACLLDPAACEAIAEVLRLRAPGWAAACVTEDLRPAGLDRPGALYRLIRAAAGAPDPALEVAARLNGTPLPRALSGSVKLQMPRKTVGNQLPENELIVELFVDERSGQATLPPWLAGSASAAASVVALRNVLQIDCTGPRIESSEASIWLEGTFRALCERLPWGSARASIAEESNARLDGRAMSETGLSAALGLPAGSILKGLYWLTCLGTASCARFGADRLAATPAATHTWTPHGDLVLQLYERPDAWDGEAGLARRRAAMLYLTGVEEPPPHELQGFGNFNQPSSASFGPPEPEPAPFPVIPHVTETPDRRARHRAAMLLSGAGEHRAAEAELTALVREEPDRARWRLARVEVFRARAQQSPKDAKTILAQLRHWASLSSRDPMAAAELACGLVSVREPLEEGDLGYASIEAKRALDLDPHITAPYYALRRVHEKRSMLDPAAYGAAMAAARTAVQLSPDDPLAHFELGLALRSNYQNPDKPEELRALEAAVRLDPEMTEAVFALASHLRIAGRAEEAIRAYERVIELEPESRYARDARKSIDHVRGQTSGSVP